MPSNKSNTKEIKLLLDVTETGLSQVSSDLKSLQSLISDLTTDFKTFSATFKSFQTDLTSWVSPTREAVSNLSATVRKTMKDITSQLDKFKDKMNTNKLEQSIYALGASGVDVSKFTDELKRLESEAKSLSDTINIKLSDAQSKLSKRVKDGILTQGQANKILERYAHLVSGTVKPAIDNWREGYNKLKASILGLNPALEKSSSIFDGFSTRFKVFFQYRAINVMTQSLYNLSKAAIDLEASFANIQAITSASDTEMNKLRGTILKVGEASKYTVEEISDATVTLGQAGLSADEINNVLETTTQLAAATGSSLQNTIDLMTSALAVWGLNSEEASHLSDVMVTGMNRTKATLETFRMAVQYAGATMASLNVSFDEFASVAAAAANAGLRASVVGTGLRAVTSELISPTTKMVKGLAQLGLNTEDVNVESQGLVNVLQKLKDAGLDASNAYSLFGRRAAQFILAAQGQLDVVNDLQLAFVESGATLKAYNTQMDTVAAEWTALANTVKEAAYKVLNETDGFLHDMIVKIKNGIKILFFDEIDDVNDGVKEVEKRIGNLKRYSELAKQFKGTDYKGDSEKQLQQFNSLVKSLNTVYGLNIDIAESVENIADRYDDVINRVEQLRKESYKERNQWVESGREKVLNEQIDQFKYDRPLINKNMGLSGYITSNAEFSKYIEDPEKSTEFRAYLRKYYDDFVKQLISAGDQLDETYGRILKEENDKFETEMIKINDELMNGYISEEEAQELVDLKNIPHSIIINALEAAKKSVMRLPELKSYEQDIVLEKTMDELNKKYDSIMKEINSSLEKNEKNLVKYQEGTATVLGEENGRLEARIKELKSIFTNLSEEDKKLLGPNNVKIIEDKIKELEQKAKNKLSDLVTGWIDGLIKIFESKGDVESRKNFERLDTNIEEDVLTKAVKQAKQDAKDTRNANRTARDIEREKARQFNKRYQELQLQAKADAYAQKSAEARREGVTSKLNTRDTTGTLASYYSSTAADLSKLESLRTAISNKETLDRYKKDYGDLFEQVKSGKVTLEDAQNKTSGLINEMMELDTNVQKAEAEFGNLNDIDLSDLNGQIATLQNKLQEIEESSETEFGKLKEGFKATIESMAKGYGSAKLGSMIAEDFGNGMADALNSIVDGSKSAKEAFSDMARSILEDISKMLIKMAVMKVMMAAFGGTNQVYSAPIGPTQISINGFNGLKEGGFIPKIRAAAGTVVRGGIQGKDSVPAMLMPGEYVLKKSAVDALGTNFLNDLNNNAAQTLTKTANDLIGKEREEDDSEPAVVNVWVVSKEEEAKMGPNDVIATISKDIMTGGTTRRLIQQVVAGRK